MGIGILLFIEILCILLIQLTTKMLLNKHKQIRYCLKAYISKRMYKTESDIRFVDRVLSVSINQKNKALLKCVKKVVYREKVGKFTYVAVKNIATKGYLIMWGISILAAALYWVNSREANWLILGGTIISLLMTLVTTGYVFLKKVSKHNDILINELIAYITEIYPEYIQKQKMQQIKDKQAQSSRDVKECKECLTTKSDQHKEIRTVHSELTAAEIEGILKNL